MQVPRRIHPRTILDADRAVRLSGLSSAPPVDTSTAAVGMQQPWLKWLTTAYRGLLFWSQGYLGDTERAPAPSPRASHRATLSEHMLVPRGRPSAACARRPSPSAAPEPSVSFRTVSVAGVVVPCSRCGSRSGAFTRAELFDAVDTDRRRGVRPGNDRRRVSDARVAGVVQGVAPGGCFAWRHGRMVVFPLLGAAASPDL